MKYQYNNCILTFIALWLTYNPDTHLEMYELTLLWLLTNREYFP